MYYWKIIGFNSSLEDSYVWYKVATGPIGFKYYTYILVCNDVILILDKSQKKYMDMLEDYYTLKL